MDQTVADGTWPTREIHIEFLDGFKNRPALLAPLKAAYLVAFAVFGYRYILRPDVENVRKELTRDGKSANIPVFSMTDAQASVEERLIMIVDKPMRLASLFVQLGRHGVFLPHPEPGKNPRLYDVLGPKGGEFERGKLHGQRVRWQQRPVFALDLADITT